MPEINVNLQNITTFSGAQLKEMVGQMSEATVEQMFKKLPIGTLLLIISQIQYASKNEEVEKFSDDLKDISDATSYIDNQIAVARQCATDGTQYTWPAQAERIGEVITPTGGTGGGITFNTNAEDAIQQLNNISKGLGDRAKKVSTEASQARTDLNAMTEAFSGALKSFMQSLQGIAQKSS